MINNNVQKTNCTQNQTKKKIQLQSRIQQVQYSPKIATKKSKLNDMLKSQQIDKNRIEKIDDVIQKYMSLNKSYLKKQPQDQNMKKPDVVFKRVRTSRKYTDLHSNNSDKNKPFIKQQKLSYNSNDAQNRYKQNLVNDVYQLNYITPLNNNYKPKKTTFSVRSQQNSAQNEYLFSLNENPIFQNSPANKFSHQHISNSKISQQRITLSNEDTDNEKIPQMRYTQQRESSKKSVKRYVIGFDREIKVFQQSNQENILNDDNNSKKDSQIQHLNKVEDIEDPDIEASLLLSNEVIDSSIDENYQQEEIIPIPMQEDNEDIPLQLEFKQVPIKLEEGLEKEKIQQDLLEKKIQSNKKNQLSQIDEIRESCFQDSYTNQFNNINIEDFYKSDDIQLSNRFDFLNNTTENSELQKSELLAQQRLEFFHANQEIPLDENFEAELPERNTLINEKRPNINLLIHKANSQEIQQDQEKKSDLKSSKNDQNSSQSQEPLMENDFSIELEQPQLKSTQNLSSNDNQKLYANYSFNKTEFLNHFNSLNNSATTDKRISSIQSNDMNMKNSFVPHQFTNTINSQVSYDFEKKSESKKIYDISGTFCFLHKQNSNKLAKKITSNLRFSQTKSRKINQKIQNFKIFNRPQKKLQKIQKSSQTQTINYEQKIKEFLLAVEMERMLFINLQLFKRLQINTNQFKFRINLTLIIWITLIAQQKNF